MIDLRLIETFVHAARRKSFSGAAKALGVSPGAVSQNIKALENQLQSRLFARTTRQVRLTDEGAEFLRRCAPALEALGDAAAALREKEETFRGMLRITATTAFGRTHVLPAIVTFRSAHPDLVIELSLNDGFADLVAEEFDLAIRAGVLPDSSYVARLLLPVTPLVCASPAYLEKAGFPYSISELNGHALIGMRSNPSQQVFEWEFRAEDGKIGRLEIKPAIIVNDPEALALAAVQGAGIAQIGSNIAAPLIREGKLVHLLSETTIRSRGIYAVYPSRRYAPRKLTAFVEHLAASLPSR